MRILLSALLGLLPLSVYANDSILLRPVNQALVGDNFVSVIPVLEMGPQFRGRRLLELVLKARTQGGQGLAAAYVNGRDVTPSQRVGPTSKLYSFALPESAQLIGGDPDQFRLRLRGPFVVEAVGLKLLPLSGPRPAPSPSPTPTPSPSPMPTPPREPRHETIWVREDFSDEDTLRLERYLDMGKYSGMHLKSVTVTGIARSEDARISFCVARGCSGSALGTERSSLQWNLDEPVGGDATDWKISLSGDMYVERIDVRFE